MPAVVVVAAVFAAFAVVVVAVVTVVVGVVSIEELYGNDAACDKRTYVPQPTER